MNSKQQPAIPGTERNSIRAEAGLRPGRRLYDAAGELLLGRKLGQGANGTVQAAANRPGESVKLFRAAITPPREAYLREKLDEMIRRGPPQRTGAFIAWPTAAAWDENGMLAGFVMPQMPRHYRGLDQVPPETMPHAQINLRQAIEGVHRAGLVIGDLHQNNIRVDQRGNPALIDVDAWQLETADRIYNAEGITKAYAQPGVLKILAAQKECRTPGCPLEGHYHTVKAACLTRSAEYDLYALDKMLKKLRQRAAQQQDS